MEKLLKICKEKKARLASILVALVVIVSSIVYTLASQNVTMTVTQIPNIDVVLTKAKTSVDLENFENDLIESLERKGITQDKVKITAVEAEDEVVTESFAWESDVSPTIGSISIANNGKDVVMYGNPSYAGKNAIWIIPTVSQEQEFDFGYNIDFGDSFNAAGMLLRVERQGDTLKGYMLSFNYTSWSSAAGGSNAAIWEFTYNIGENNKNFTKTLKKPLTINTSGNLHVKVSDKEITVSGGGLSSPETYVPETLYGSGYGFFSDHYSHGCNNIGQFKLTNINLKTVSIKDFNEVLRAPEWREEACKVLVNVSDVSNEQFDESSAQLTEIISRLMNDDIHYIGWGTDINQSEMENAIAENDGKGLYLDNSDYDAAIEATAKYIKESLAGIGDSRYIISNEPVVVKVNPQSEATNTANEEYPDGKWKVEHDYLYFENNEGQYEKSGIYTQDVINEFTKPGSYKVYHEGDLVTEIFAHRRPVAAFTMQKDEAYLTLTSTSYDVDNQSRNNGIQEEEWSYKKIGTNNWVKEKLTVLEPNSRYIIKLRVKDYQDTWSMPATKYISSENIALNPIAEFRILNKEISLYKQLQVTDTSYDPTGLELTKWTWTVKKDGATVYTGATPLLDYKDKGEGTYTMSLVVRNSANKDSEVFSQTFKITPDITAPEFIADITTGEAVSELDVNLNFTDLESGFKSYKYAITSTTDEPSDWTTVNCTEENVKIFSSKVHIGIYGKWYIHIKATDNAGNESKDRVLGLYNILKAYKVEIQAVDSVSNAGLQGAKFQLVGTYENGDKMVISDDVKTTNSSGKIVFEKIPLTGITSLEIINKEALSGYEQAEAKLVTTDTSTNKIVVVDNLTSDDVKTNVSSDGETINIRVPIAKKKFQLKITNIDSTNSNIKLSGAEFVLKYQGREVGRGTTKDGELVIESTIGLTSGVGSDFVLQQVSAARGYNTTRNTTLTCTFTGDGVFKTIRQPIIGENPNVVIKDASKAEIIVKNDRDGSANFSVVANVVDADDNNLMVQGSTYKLKVETSMGLSYVTDAVTSNSYGLISFTDLYGDGIVKLTFIHEGAAREYSLSTGDRYVTVENNGGTITYNQASTAGVFQRVENKTVYVKLNNIKKSSTNSLKIKAYNVVDTDATLPGVEFEVYNFLDGSLVGKGTTDDDGIFRIDDIRPDGEGEILYRIEAVNQTITEIPSGILVSVSFDSKGNAISATRISSSAGVSVDYSEEDSEYLFRRTANVNIGTRVNSIPGETTLRIRKTESDGMTPIQGSRYKIKINYNNKVTTTVYNTDENGEFSLKVPDTDRAVITLLEVKAPNGYTLDSTEKSVELRVNSEGELTPYFPTLVNLDPSDIEAVNDGTYRITIKETGISLRYPKLHFNIAKIDKTGDLNLGGVEFKLTNQETGEFENLTTDANGAIQSSVYVINQPKDYTFELEEIKTVDGYELPNNTFIIRISFEDKDNFITYTGEKYLSGDQYIAYKSSDYNNAINELAINLTIRNYEDKSAPSVYGLDVQKVDSDGNILTGSKYDIEIRPFATNIISAKNMEITNDVEISPIKITNNKSTILLKEVQPAFGFSKDSHIKVITVYRDETGKLKYESESTSSDLDVQILEVDETQDDGTIQKKTILKVTIVAKTGSEEDDPNGGGGNSGGSGTSDSLALLSVRGKNGTDPLIVAQALDNITYKLEIPYSYTELDLTAIVNNIKTKVSINDGEQYVQQSTEHIEVKENITYATIMTENEQGETRRFTVIITKVADESLAIKSVKAEYQDEDDVTKTSEGIKLINSDYDVVVDEEANEAKLIIETVDPNSLVSIEGEPYTVNTQSKIITLGDDPVTVNVVISKSDYSASQAYKVTISKKQLIDVLVISAVDAEGTKFATRRDETSFELEVSEENPVIPITVTSKYPTTLVNINGGAYNVSNNTADITLAKEGFTYVTIGLTTPDGSQYKEITLRITTPDTTFAFRLYNRNNGDYWKREYNYTIFKYSRDDTYAQALADRDGGEFNMREVYRSYSYWNPHWGRWFSSSYLYGYNYTIYGNFEFIGAQRLPVFFKDKGVYGSHLNWGPNGGYPLLNSKLPNTLLGKLESSMYVEARLVENGVVSNEIYEVKKLKENPQPIYGSRGELINKDEEVANDKNGSHVAYFKKEYAGKEVEFTIVQELPYANAKKFDNYKVKVLFDENGKIVSGDITQGMDTVDLAVGGISQAGIVKDIQYPGSEDGIKDEIEYYNSIGTNTLYVGVVSNKANNPTKVNINLKDDTTLEGLNGAFSVIAYENSSGRWQQIEASTLEVENGFGTITLNNTYTNRDIKFKIVQTTKGSHNGNNYTIMAKTPIEIDVKLDNDGNISSINEISTPYAESNNRIGSNTLEYTVYNEREYNFVINLTKLDENGKPLPGVKLETTSMLFVNTTTTNGVQVDKYGAKATNEEGETELRINLPIDGANTYYGKVLDVTIREYYVPDNYKAYQNIKVRILFDSQGRIKVVPQLLNEPFEGAVTIANEYEENAMSMTIQNSRIPDEEKPYFEITNLDAKNRELPIEGMRYKVISWDEAEYEVTTLNYKEVSYTNVSNENDGKTNVHMSNGHALKTIIYTLQEDKTSEAYEANQDIRIRVVYDENGKIKEQPKILTDEVTSEGRRVASFGSDNSVGSSTIYLTILHDIKPTFVMGLFKYEVERGNITRRQEFRVTSQLKQEDGTYADIYEDINSRYTDGRIEAKFRKAYNNQTALFTIYEKLGETEVERGQTEITFDAYGVVTNTLVLNQQSPNNYLGTRLSSVSQKSVTATIYIEEFRIKINLVSQPTEPYRLDGATFEIKNSLGEVCDIQERTDSAGTVSELVGEVYKGKTINYTIKQLKAPANYDLMKNDIEFDVTFADDGTIDVVDPIAVENKYEVTSTVKDNRRNNMAMNIFVAPSGRERIIITSVNEEDRQTKIPSAKYDISAVVISPDTSRYLVELRNGTTDRVETTITNRELAGDLGPDKNFYGKTVQYKIKQKEVDDKYILNETEVIVTVEYDLDGTIKSVNLQGNYGDEVTISNPTTGEISNSMLQNVGGLEFQVNMVNHRKSIFEIKNVSQEDEGYVIANAKYQISETTTVRTYSDTQTTYPDGYATLHVGPVYTADDGEEYIEKTYTIRNINAGFGFNTIPNGTFTLKYNSAGDVIGGTVSSELAEYITIETFTEEEYLEDLANRGNNTGNTGDSGDADTGNTGGAQIEIPDVRLVIKSKPLFTVGIEAVNEITGAKISGMKYQVRQVSPTGGQYQDVTTNSNTTAHAAPGATIASTVVTYEITEREVATGYKYIDKNNVIVRFEVTYDGYGHITNNINGEKINITHGSAYTELIDSVDKFENFDLDIKIKYVETDELVVKIKNMNQVDTSDYITSTFTANIDTISQTGTTDENGELSFVMGQRPSSGNESIVITQNSVQGSYARINPIRIELRYNENGKISSWSAYSGNGYATHNVAYKVIQPNGTVSSILEIEVYNNPVTTFKIENVDQGDDTIKLQSEFTLSGNNGIAQPIVLVTDSNGKANAQLDSVPKDTSVIYTIVQTETAVPSGYGRVPTIKFEVRYSNDGNIQSVVNLSTGEDSGIATNTSVEFDVEDNNTLSIKIKSKRKFGLYVETVDAYNESIKLGAEIYVTEDLNRQNATIRTDAGVGKGNAIIGTNIANRSLTYEIRLVGTPTTPDGINQTYYYDENDTVYVRVTFDEFGNVNDVTYSDNAYVCNRFIVETDRANGVAVDVKIRYIPNLTVNINRKDGITGDPLKGRGIKLSSDRMKEPGESTTDDNGFVTFDGGRIADDDGTQVTYRIVEDNSVQDYNYPDLPTDMEVYLTYDENGNIKTILTNYPENIVGTGIGTRTLELDIHNSKDVKIILSNSDYYVTTSKISGKYTIISSKNERIEIVTQSNTSTGALIVGTPISLGKIYPGEDVKYTIHNDEAQYGYEILEDIEFIVHYEDDGSITINPNNFSNQDKLNLIALNQEVTEDTANINLDIRSKPCLMVKMEVKDKNYNQPIEKVRFEIVEDETGFVNTVEGLTNEDGIIEVPIKTAKENTTVHYTIRQSATNGGYRIINPVGLIVKYNSGGVIDETGTYTTNTNIMEIVQGYSEPLYASDRVRGIKLNVYLETMLGIGINKIDKVTGKPIQGVTFKVTEEVILGNNQGANTDWSNTTDINGEMTVYTRDIDTTARKVRYTIEEVEPVSGYRKIEDIILDVTLSGDRRVQSVVVVQNNNPPGYVNINPVEDMIYNLKKMAESKEYVHIQIDIYNDDAVTFKIVNLDKGFEDSEIDVPIANSEFVATVLKNGTIVKTYSRDEENVPGENEDPTLEYGKKLITNSNGEASITMYGPGTLEIDYEQIYVEDGYILNQRNKGFIRIEKSATEYLITYNDSTDGIKYNVDPYSGVVTVYLYNENNLIFDLNNVDIDEPTIYATNADQIITAYYGDRQSTTEDILNQTENVKYYNNGVSYNILTGREKIELGNTYDLLDKKVVFEIDTLTPPVGYNRIGKVYLVAEIDKYGKLVSLRNETSERIIEYNIVNSHYLNVFVGFGDLDKFAIKIVKEGINDTRLNGASFSIATELEGFSVDIGVPTTATTGDRYMGEILVETGVFEVRKLNSRGKIKLEMEETQAPQGYQKIDGKFEVTFDSDVDESDPDEPRALISNIQTNHSNVKAEFNVMKRELIITVENENKIKINVEKVDEDENLLQGITFNAEVQIENEPLTATTLNSATTDENGNLQIELPTEFTDSVLLVTLKEQKEVYYKQLQPIVLRMLTGQDGRLMTTPSIISGLNQDDGNGGATILSADEDSVSIKVENMFEEAYKPFKLSIIKENAENHEIKIADAKFQIKVTPQVGVAIYKIANTDENGLIELPRVIGEGNIKVELQELEPPVGYKFDLTEGYYTFTLNKSENGLVKVTSSLGDNEVGEDNLEIDSDNRIVVAHVPNLLDKIMIAIEKVDENNGMKIKGATFQLIDTTISDPDHYSLITTNSKGLATFYVDKKDRAGTYKYKIMEVSKPQGYKPVTEEMSVEITYNINGEIESAVEDGERILLTEQDVNKVTLEVSNAQEPLNVPAYTIKVINTDKSNVNVVIPESEFDMKVVQEQGSAEISQHLIMDVNGQHSVPSINGAGDIQITIKETKTGEGYMPDLRDKVVRLHRNDLTGDFTVLGSQNSYAEYDKSTNVLTIRVSNEKERGFYDLVINKVNSNGTPIEAENIEFEVLIGDETKTVKTDAQGKIYINKLKINDDYMFDIQIKEITEPGGYIKEEETQIVSVFVQPVYGENMIKDATVTYGNSVSVVNTSDTVIELNFMNMSADDYNLYLLSNVYEVNDEYVEKVPAWTTIADYLANMESNGTMKVYDSRGNEITDTTKFVGTGMVIKATKHTQEIAKTIIVSGDVTGNGQIKLLDVSKVNQHFVGQTPLEGIFLKAADMNGDGRVSLLDVSRVNQAFVNH